MSELVVGSIAGLAANSYVVSVASGSKLVQPGSVLQVVSTTKTDAFTTTSTSFTDVTGLTASITPSSTSSKIMVFVTLGAAGNTDGVNYAATFQIARGGTGIGAGANGASRYYHASSASATGIGAISYLDSPSSTSSLTYSVQLVAGGGSTAFLNRNSAGTTVYSSTITVMEIAG